MEKFKSSWVGTCLLRSQYDL